MGERQKPPKDERDAAPAGGPEGADLVTIGLAVFFVSLLLIVGALLVLPAVF